MNGPVPIGLASHVSGSSSWAWAITPKRLELLRKAGNARQGTPVVTFTAYSSTTSTDAMFP